MADVARGITISLGGAVLAVAMLRGAQCFARWRETKNPRWGLAALRIISSAAGIALLIAILGEHVGQPLSYRTPISFCVFVGILISIIGNLSLDRRSDASRET